MVSAVCMDRHRNNRLPLSKINKAPSAVNWYIPTLTKHDIISQYEFHVPVFSRYGTYHYDYYGILVFILKCISII